MSMSEKIKILLIKRNITLKELSDGIGTSSSNLSNKLKRDNFAEKELIEIGEFLNCKYKASFILNDTKEEILL